MVFMSYRLEIGGNGCLPVLTVIDIDIQVTLVPKEFLQSHLNIRREAVQRNHRKLGTVPDRLE